MDSNFLGSLSGWCCTLHHSRTPAGWSAQYLLNDVGKQRQMKFGKDKSKFLIILIEMTNDMNGKLIFKDGPSSFMLFCPYTGLQIIQIIRLQHPQKEDQAVQHYRLRYYNKLIVRLWVVEIPLVKFATMFAKYISMMIQPTTQHPSWKPRMNFETYTYA